MNPNTTGSYPRSPHPSGHPPIKGPSKAPLGLSAGGGLAVGFLVGFFLIAGSGEDKEAVASNDTTEETAETGAAANALAEEGEAKAAERGDVAPDLGAVDEGEGDSDTEGADTESADTEGEGGAAEAETASADSEGEPEEDKAEATPEPEPVEVEPVILTAAVKFEIKPTDIEGLKVTVDGQEENVLGFSTNYEEGRKKKVTVRAKAKGFRDFKKIIRIDGDTTVPITMRPVSSGGGEGKPKRPKKKKGPGGLISL